MSMNKSVSTYTAMVQSAWEKQVEVLKSQLATKILKIQTPSQDKVDMLTLEVSKEHSTEVLGFLKTQSECEYQFLSDITATDENPSSQKEPRFIVVYHLLSHSQAFARVRVKVALFENEEIDSIIHLWDGANWAEREVFDMFGIRFKGHPDLRRILMDARWVGHPLRKDYPLKGYQIFPTPEPIDPELLK